MSKPWVWEIIDNKIKINLYFSRNKWQEIKYQDHGSHWKKLIHNHRKLKRNTKQVKSVGRNTKY